MADRSVLVRLRAHTSDFERGMVGAARSVNTLRKEIDTTNDRTAWLVQGLLALGPALVPIGAAVVPVIAGLATQMGLAAAAAGTAALAFNGVGDALDALNDFQLEPTAENLEKMQQAMAKIGPEGAEFVAFLDSVGPKFAELQMAAREGMFPGMEEGINSLVDMLPQVESIVTGISEAMGELSASAGEGLSGEGFEDFFDYLDTQVKPLLIDMGQTVGNFVEGFAAMAVAFAPLTESFSNGLLNMSQSFQEWAHGLDSSDSFASFLAYVQESGPMVLDLFGSLVDLFVQLVQAAAPVGDILVPALTMLADALSVIVNTPIGPAFILAVAAMSAYGRVAALATISTSGLGKAMLGVFQVGKIKAGAAAFTEVASAQQRATMTSVAFADAEAKRNATMRAGVAQAGKSAAAMAGLALMTTDAADSTNLSNTASLALMGTLAGPWGAAVGGAVGMVMDFAHSNDALVASMDALDASMAGNDIAKLESDIETARAQLKGMDDDIRNMSFGESMLGGFSGLTDIGPAMGFLTGDTADLAEKTREAEERVAGLRDGSIQAFNPVMNFAGAVMEVADAAEAEQLALEGAIGAMRAKREEALRGLNAELNYKASLLDARDALKENGETVNENTRAGQANLRTLYAMPAAWNEQSNALKNAKGAVQTARREFIEMAVAMNMPIGKAERLAQRLFEIKPKNVKVGVETDDAMAKAQRLQAQLDNINDKQVKITITTINRAVHNVIGGAFGEAAGGYIRGPGTATSDSIPAWLSDKEYVVRAAMVEKYGVAMFHAINAGRFADGGQVGGGQSQSWDPFGPVGAAVAGVVRGLRGLQAQLAASEEAVERERSARDAVRGQMAELSGSVASGLRSDIFAAPANVWSANANVSASSVLQADIARGREFITLVEQLKSKGLKGPALAELLASNSMPRARLYASMSAADLASYAALYEEREAVLAQAGQVAASAAYGGAEAAADRRFQAELKELREIKQAIKAADQANKDGHQNTADHAGGAQNSAAANARRRAKRNFAPA